MLKRLVRVVCLESYTVDPAPPESNDAEPIARLVVKAYRYQSNGWL